MVGEDLPHIVIISVCWPYYWINLFYHSAKLGNKWIILTAIRKILELFVPKYEYLDALNFLQANFIITKKPYLLLNNWSLQIVAKYSYSLTLQRRDEIQHNAVTTFNLKQQRSWYAIYDKIKQALTPQKRLS